jgi:uncharacterized protein (UPF0264 family)
MRWSGLLVSVRDATEAAEALAGGAAIIDVKEPRHGPLGPADPRTTARVAAAVGARVPWTMACGELAQAAMTAGADGRVEAGVAAIRRYLASVLSSLPRQAAAPAAVKVGLAGLGGSAWRRPLRDLFAGMPAECHRVAVAYADWHRAAAPAPEEVIDAAADLGAAAVLFDTFDKSSGGLFACCPAGSPAVWMRAARDAGLRVAVAGRISLAEIPAAWGLGPDVVALRSAVCFNGRDGAVAADLVRQAVRLGHGPGTVRDRSAAVY